MAQHSVHSLVLWRDGRYCSVKRDVERHSDSWIMTHKSACQDEKNVEKQNVNAGQVRGNR